MPRIKRRWILIGLGVAPYIFMQAWVLREQPIWAAMKFPAMIRKGIFQSPEFITRSSTTYVMHLEFDRSLAFDRMNCLVGLAFFEEDKKKCNGIPEVLDLKWTVTSNGRVVNAEEMNPTRIGQFSEGIGREIGRFEGTKGQLHKVELEMRKSSEELDVAKPRLVVQVHWSEWEGITILNQTAFTLALIPAGAGAFLLIRGLVRRFRGPAPA